MHPLFVVVPLLGFVAPASAQTPPRDHPPEDTLRVYHDAEQALDGVERDADEAEQLAERLNELAEHPLDLNTAPAEALAQIPGLSPLLARRIVRFRNQHGPFETVSSLQAVEGMSSDLLPTSRPYLSVSPKSLPSSGPYPSPPAWQDVMDGLQFDLIQRYTRRLDLGKGFAPPAVRRVTAAGDTIFATRYLGRPGRLYTRFRARYKRHVSVALTMDKDPGERFVWDPSTQTYGYDHVSAHVALHDYGRLKTFVAGDFNASFGQGLTLGPGSTFGKGRNPVQSIARSGRGIDDYGSAQENRFFRGLAATVHLSSQLEASSFVSRRTLDASRAMPDTTSPPPNTGAANDVARITTLAESGLHRTPNELSKKDALGETLFGGALEYDTPSFRIGATGYHARFDAPLQPDTIRLFRRFDFSGRQSTAASLYAQVFVGDYFFFGEGGRAPGGALGGVGGMLATFSRFAEALVVARHYPRDFTSLHGNAFGERSGATQNETGFYTGLRLRPHTDWTVKGYFDLYRFPWVRFAVGRPSSGYDARFIIEHTPYDWLSAYLQLRTETREAGADILDEAGRTLDGLIDETRQSARLHLDYIFSDRLRLRSRIEGVRYFEAGPHFAEEDYGAQHETDYGLLLYQDVRWRPLERLRLDARLAFFDTDSYAARVYAYENDLLYSFSVPALSGRGQRFYLLARYAPSPSVILELKYAATHFRGVETTGSGLTETDGPQRRDLRAQVRLKF